MIYEVSDGGVVASALIPRALTAGELVFSGGTIQVLEADGGTDLRRGRSSEPGSGTSTETDTLFVLGAQLPRQVRPPLDGREWRHRRAPLAALAAAVGIHGKRTADSPGSPMTRVATVLAAVNAAVMELGLVRQRRAIEGAAFDNIWRGD
jgi:hypothetical protein